MNLTKTIKDLYQLKNYQFKKVESHFGGRNIVYICSKEEQKEFVIRISNTNDRLYQQYQAECEFVHYLASNGASVADVIPSINGKFVEEIIEKDQPCFVSAFQYAKGMLISDNGYQYRKGATLKEYFYNTGKTLGKMHALAKEYNVKNDRLDYFDKYNQEYIQELIPESYKDLKEAIFLRLEKFKKLSKSKETYGLVHFDFSDGNYHIDMDNGNITVFDFDNCMKCWYMFDLANLWTHGVGWCQFEQDKAKRKGFMDKYFATIVEGYKSQTTIEEDMLKQLPLFIDMVLIENIVDEFECCQREKTKVDYEDIEEAAQALIENISYCGFC